MDDRAFVDILNRIARTGEIALHPLHAGDGLSGDEMDRWASFLGLCMNEGVPLDDERWGRIQVLSSDGGTVFRLKEPDQEKGKTEGHDSDFRVGLQLLLGLLTGYEEARGRRRGE
jgi:hypothetical protein